MVDDLPELDHVGGRHDAVVVTVVEPEGLVATATGGDQLAVIEPAAVAEGHGDVMAFQVAERTERLR